MQRPKSAMPARWIAWLAVFAALGAATRGYAQDPPDAQLAEAAALLYVFTADDDSAIPAELLQRARGIAVIPGVFRGGFIFGARRGRGVVAVRDERGEWSNPAFLTLTGGSFGWQFGAESTDIVLVFANDSAVKNMSRGKFTLGGDATAVAGPLGRTATAAVTFRAEVYGYVRSRGLFAGAAFEGTRLDIDDETNARYYAGNGGARPLAARNAATPVSAQRFLATLREVAAAQPVPQRTTEADAQEAVTFPLE